MKTKTIGYLYELATDAEFRNSWNNKPEAKWERFYDLTNADDTTERDQAELVGQVACGNVELGDQDNISLWKAIALADKSLVFNSLLGEGCYNDEAYQADSGSQTQKLPIVLAQIVFHSEHNKAYLEDPASYVQGIADNLPNPKQKPDPMTLNLSEALKKGLIEFGDLIKQGSNDAAATYYDEVLADELADQLYREQSLVW
jgi:hypothetical protein